MAQMTAADVEEDSTVCLVRNLVTPNNKLGFLTSGIPLDRLSSWA